MLSITKTTNMSGVSTIGKEQAAYMSASIQTDGKYNVNYAIQNPKLYADNKEEVKQDMDAFEEAVENVASEIIL